ncbi:LamG domain-containing protein [Sulfuriflexus mobilis]|uniref:LamG domain-containing protein n=1 Tax=Sulfuriflexus mobilis TaxID=1811807 RepID=UPI001559AA37|nr:LamG domain-containing protein [Sulfuriflexus mobilis]
MNLPRRPLLSWLLLISSLIGCLLFTALAQAAVNFRAAAQNAINTIPTATTISHIGTGSPQGITGCGSINPSIPPGTNGDLLIALAMAKEDDGGNDVTMPGWNTYYAATYPGNPSDTNEMQVRIFWRFANSTDPNTITQAGSFCNAGDGSGLGGQISRFRGVDPASPFETPGPGVVAQDSNNIDTGSITTTSPTAMLLVAGFISNNRNVTEQADANGNWSEAFDFAYNDGGAEPDLGITLNYQRQTTAGPRSISNWPTGGTDENIGAIFALSPAPLVSAAGLAINVPTGTIRDDVMIASVAARPASITITAPAGWTLIRKVTQPNANSSVLETYYRVAGASEPADYTWTFSAAGFTGAAGGIASFSGVDTATPIDAELGNPTPNGTTHTAPDITTTQDGGMLVTTHEFTSSRMWTPPAGMTEAVDVSSLPPNNAIGIAMEINYEARPTASATGPRTASVGGNADVGATQSISLLPAPPPPPQLLAYFRMDEISWGGSAGEVVDLSGNGRHGTAVDGISTRSVSPARPGSPGTCRYGEIPENNATGTTEAVDTRVNVTTDVGNTGSISFWYKSNVDWDGGENRQLLDASTTANGQKYFFLQVRNGSRLRFALEDSNDGDFQLETGDNIILADDWVHIAITWDLPNDTLQIYIDGNLAAEDTTFNTNGELGGLNTIYLGDNRSSYFASGSSNRSANGSIDEARIYNFVQTTAQIQADRNATHGCALGILDHFDIIVPVFGSVCNTNNSEITIIARDFLGNTITDYTGLINLSTSNGLGDWSLVAGNGPLSNGAADDGAGTYQFVAIDNGIVVLDLGMSDDADVAITVQDAFAGIISTSATIDFRRGNRSLLVTNRILSVDPLIVADPINIAGRPEAMSVARLDNNCMIDTNFNDDRQVRAWITRDINDPNGIAPSINGVSLPNADPGGNNLTGANQLDFINGVASFNLDTTDVGKYILNIRDGNRRGSSDSITTRPFGFAFTNIQDAGGIPNPRGTATAGDGFVAADASFNATLGAYLWQTADDLNNNGVPDTPITNLTNNGLTPHYDWDTALSPILDTPAGGILGSLTPTMLAKGTFADGQVTIMNMAYSEVGSIFMQADASDYLNSPGVNINGTSRYDDIIVPNMGAGVVGRFFPDHFTLTASNVAAACGAFTYMSQPELSISYSLQARSLNNNKTDNYDTAAGYKTTDSMDNDTLSLHAEDNNDGVDMTARVSSVAGNWVAGEYSVNDPAASFDRAAAGPDGAFQTLQLSLQMNDELDSRNIAGRDQKPGVMSDCTMVGDCDSITIGMPTDVRFGRFRIANAYGSELLPLSIPLSTEYFLSDAGGGGFITNANDVCVSYDVANNPVSNANNLVFSNYLGSLDAGEVAATVTMPPADLISGLSDPAKPLVLHLPGDVTLGPGAGNDGSATISLTVEPWLQFDWDNTDGLEDGPYDDDPSATATFGIFRGNDATIYRRELY